MAALLRAEELPHYTYDDYQTWEGRWEIIYGVPYAMSPQPTFRHQRISARIAAELHTLLLHSEKFTSMLPIDWQIADDTVVNPDNVVVRGRPEGVKLTEPPVIAFEVLSPSTMTKDRKLKYRLYEAAGLPYYVIVDPGAEEAEVYELVQGAYLQQFKGRAGVFTFQLDGVAIRFDFALIWD